MLKTPDSNTAHQRQSTPKITLGSAHKSMSTRLTNYVRAPSSQPGETKKTSSCGSCCGRRSGHHPPPLRRTVRVRHPRPTRFSSHQKILHFRASAGRIPRPIRPDGHPPALGRRTSAPCLQPAPPFHSRTPPLSPERHSRFYTHPLEGIAGTHQVGFRHFCFCSFELSSVPPL